MASAGFVCLLLVLLIITLLTHRAQATAAKAMAARDRSERLYETSRRMLLLDPSAEAGPLVTSLVREAFSLRAALVFDAVSARTHAAGEGSAELEEGTRSACFRDADLFDAETDTWFCVLRLGTRPVGAIALAGGGLTPLVATAVASLSAIAMERARSFEKECRLEAVRRSEQLRGAVLDALAHEIKTPLAVIRTASSGMLAAGGLAEREGALVTLIDEQVERLGLLTSRLLQTARLDREELAPSRERLLLSEVAAAAVQGLSPPGSGSRVRLIPPDRETAVMADRDLLTTALAHLLDNAVKYSLPESPIEVRVARSDARMKATVRNRGKVISPAERERIFERFYRTPEARDGPEGTGLGLSIVKKIVEAHQGAVWAEPDAGDGMVFSLALPSAPPSEP